jgi:hypothetical protein
LEQELGKISRNKQLEFGVGTGIVGLGTKKQGGKGQTNKQEPTRPEGKLLGSINGGKMTTYALLEK